MRSCLTSVPRKLQFCDSSEVQWPGAKDSLSGKHIDNFPYEMGFRDKFSSVALVSTGFSKEYSVLAAFI